MTDDLNRSALRDAFFEGYRSPPPGLAQRALEHAHEQRKPERQRTYWAAGLVAVVLAVVMVATLLLTRAGVGHQPQRPAPAAPPPGTCRAAAPPRLIVVDLAAQELTAYQRGCAVLSTPVTTGGPGTPTPTGTFQVLVKEPSHMLVSPYPEGSPHWYPEILVHDYLAISSDGLALHSAEWEPDAAFGPRSEEGAYASHGTVHVPTKPLETLYSWADAGTTVLICGPGGPEPACGGFRSGG